MSSPYLDHPPRSLAEFRRDKMIAVLNDHAAEEFVRVVWADGTWAMVTAGEMIAELRADAVADADKIDRLEFL